MASLKRERFTRTAGVCGGCTCIAGHRIRVFDLVICHEHGGLSADEIVSQFPSINLDDVNAALAYYRDHREEIQDEIRTEREKSNQFTRDRTSILKTRLGQLE